MNTMCCVLSPKAFNAVIVSLSERTEEELKIMLKI